MCPKPLRSLTGAFAAALLLLAGGCGPGVGGTGTGSALQAFQASAASVCDSSFAARLACGPALPGAASPGTQKVRYADASRQLVLEIEGNRATLDAACPGAQFSGDFGVAPGNAAAFYGTYQVSASMATTFASLLVQPGDAGGDLRIELRDIDGRSLVAPVTLQAAPTPLPAPGPCH